MRAAALRFREVGALVEERDVRLVDSGLAGVRVNRDNSARCSGMRIFDLPEIQAAPRTDDWRDRLSPYTDARQLLGEFRISPDDEITHGERTGIALSRRPVQPLPVASHDRFEIDRPVP